MAATTHESYWSRGQLHDDDSSSSDESTASLDESYVRWDRSELVQTSLPRTPESRSMPANSHRPQADLPRPLRGFDFRRPVMTQNSSISNNTPTVVDLTGSDDPPAIPNFGDILALVSARARARATGIGIRPLASSSADRRSNRNPPRSHVLSTNPARQSQSRVIPRSGQTANDSRLGQSGLDSSRRPYRENRRIPSLRREADSDLVFVRRAPATHPSSDANNTRTTRETINTRGAGLQVSHVIHDLTDESNTFTNNNIQRNNEDGNNDDDDVIFVESRQSSTAPASENRRIFPPIATSSTLSGIMNRSLANVRARAQPEVFEHWFTRMAQEHGRGANFTTPQLNYQTPAWDMGYRSSNTDFPTFQSPPSTTLAPPQIVPPDPPAEGFTRNPAAGQVVVCPACGDELTQGATEDKQQVWVVKACGHVYCGPCIRNRSRRKTQPKGKTRATDLPISRLGTDCLIDDCKSKLSGKSSVMQIFL